MLEHPKALGFELGLIIHIDEPAQITKEEPAAKRSDVVYVALLKENDGPLEKGVALKVGETGGTLLKRWKDFRRIFGPSARPNEISDARKWLEVAKGQEVAVWVKEPGEIEISYARGLLRSSICSRLVEEAFWDHYYQPRVRGQRYKEAAKDNLD